MRSEATDPDILNPTEPALEAIVAPVCRAHGVELVSVTVQRGPGGGLVKLVIDREGPAALGSGVTLADCTDVSRDVSAALDVHEDAVEGPYRLEVSSPGLERPLVRRSDFERFAGREVRVHTRSGDRGRRRFVGKLVRVVDESVELELDGLRVPIPLEEITKANLVFRFDKHAQKGGQR